MRTRRSWMIVVACALVVGVGYAARAGSLDGNGDPVQMAFGSFAKSFPIEVPKFKGLTPNVSLQYSSGGASGLAGVDWDVTGAISIQRASADKGPPRYDATDIFLLNGQELVPCAVASASPGCLAGGNYATKVESYAKIYFDANYDYGFGRWTMTAQDGSKATFDAVFKANVGGQGCIWGYDANGNPITTQYDKYGQLIPCPPGEGNQTFRWSVTKYEDTRANAVTTSWWCDGVPGVCVATYDKYGVATTYCQGGIKECYPDTMSYGSLTTKNTIKFYREARADAPSYSTGKGLAQTAYRIRSIEVKAGTTKVRAYKLTYNSSGSTGRDRLASVTQYGTDYVIDAAGLITGGTTLPVMTYGYPSGSKGFTKVQATTSLGAVTATYRRHVGDFDGDGNLDLLNPASTFGVARSPNGSPLSTYGSVGITQTSDYNTVTGDFDGDGRTDIAVVNKVSPYNVVAVWRYLGTTWTKTTPSNSWSMSSTRDNWIVADYNRDGKDDIASLISTSQLAVHYSNGNGTFGNAVVYGGGSFKYPTGSQFGDFDGDGIPDVFSVQTQYWPVISSNKIFVSYFTGSALVARVQPGLLAANKPTLIGDFNGDGFADVASIASSTTIYINSSVGRGRPFVTATYGGMSLRADYGTLNLVGDFNGDGRADIASVSSTTAAYVHYATGAGFTKVSHASLYFDNSSAVDAQNYVGDFNGDGLDDIGAFEAATNKFWISKSTATLDLMTSLTTGLGGTITVAYTPSSRYSNTNNPPLTQVVSSLTMNDGRGGVATNSYSYSGGYYDRADRQSLGFRYVKRTPPKLATESTAPYTEYYYMQDRASVGKPEYIYIKSSSGAKFTQTQNVYTVNVATLPYTSLLTGVWQYDYNQGSTYKRTYINQAYDTYGNQTLQYHYGNYDVSGDETTTYQKFYPNAPAGSPTGAYIVNRPAYGAVYDGLTTATASRIALTYFYYDGSTNNAAPPVRGEQTWVSKYNQGVGGYVDVKKEYDAYGNVTKVIDPLIKAETIGYDATYKQYPASRTNAVGHTSTAVFNYACGAASSTVDSNGQTLSHSYDALCRLTQSTGPLSSTARTQYNNFGTVSTQHNKTLYQSPAGDLYKSEYFDGFGRIWKVEQSGVGAATVQETKYDARGNLAQMSLPYKSGTTVYWATKAYDQADRTTRITSPDGTFGTYSYGLLTRTVTDENGNQQIDNRDVFGRITSHQEKLGTTWNTTTYVYNKRSELTSVTDPKGNVTTMAYDGLGRKTSGTDRDAGTLTSAFDLAGRLTRGTDARGQVTSHYYDALGRLTKKIAGSATYTWTYDQAVSGYYNKGRLTTATFPNGSTQFRYDALGRQVWGQRVIDGVTYTTTRGYHAGGQILWTTLPDGDTIGTAGTPLAYDAAGRLNSISGYLNGVLYDPMGRATKVTYGNNNVSTWTYSATRGYVTQIATKQGSTVHQQLDYTYDAAGRLTKVLSVAANEGWSYGYDTMNHLTAATNLSNGTYTQTTTFDAIGNMLTNSRLGTYGYPASGASSVRPHAVTSAGANTYAYDASGNMISGAGRTIAWNSENRPSAVGTATFAYDDSGFRIKKVEGGVTTIFVSGEYEVKAGTVTKYVRLGELLVAKKVGSTKYFIHPDQQGSANLITDSAGAVTLRTSFRPWGEVLSTSSGHAQTRGYTGQQLDDTGLMYLHARYYDPQLGRFISPDPTVPTTSTIGLNRYAYAFNSPVSHVDVDGLGWNPLKKISHALRSVGRAFKSVVKAIGKAASRLFAGALHAVARMVGMLPPWLGIVVMIAFPELSPAWGIAIMNAGYIAAGIDMVAFAAEGKWAEAKMCMKLALVGVIMLAATWGAYEAGLLAGKAMEPVLGIIGGMVAGAIAGAAAGYVLGYASGVVTARLIGFKGELAKQWVKMQAAAGFWAGAFAGAFATGNEFFGEKSTASAFGRGVWKATVAVGAAGLMYQGRGFHSQRDYVGARPDGTGYSLAGDPYFFFGGAYGNNMTNYLAHIHDRAAESRGYGGNTGYNGKMAWDVSVQLCMLGAC